MVGPAVAWLLHCAAPLSAGVAAATALHVLSGSWIWVPLVALLLWGLWSVLQLLNIQGTSCVDMVPDAESSTTEEDLSEDCLEELTNTSDVDLPHAWNPKPVVGMAQMDHAAHLYELARLETARLLRQPYKSRLGHADKVCIKVATDQPLSSIPKDLAPNIQAALSNLGFLHHRVLDIAARPGCITFSLDICHMPSCTTTSTTASTAGTWLGRGFRWLLGLQPRSVSVAATSPAATATAAAPTTTGTMATAAAELNATSVASALLPVFTPLLSEEAATAAVSPIQFVVHGKQFAACWDSSNNTWCLQATSGRAVHAATGSTWTATASSTAGGAAGRQHAPLPVTTRRHHPYLGFAYQVTPVAPADNDAWLDSFPEGSRGSTTSMKSCSSGSDGSSSAASLFDSIMSSNSSGVTLLSVPEPLHQMRAHVSMLYPHSHSRTTQHSVVGGWKPPAHGQHYNSTAYSAGEPWLQLLVRCEGSYLPTTVRPFDGTTLQVEFAVPDSSLPRHHVGGAPVGLLPVTLELWQGPLHCISSMPLLLQVSDVADAGQPREVWWWGTCGNTARLATLQLQATAWQLSQSAAPEEWLGSWQDFLADLCTWLFQVRMYATTSQHCVSAAVAARSIPGTALTTPSLSPQELCLLGEDLQEYTCSSGLQHVRKLFLQQQAVVRSAARTCCHCHDAATAAQQQPHSWGALIWASVAGFCCSQCESRSHIHICQQLGSIGVYSSMVSAVMGALLILRGLVSNDTHLTRVALPWTLSHLLLLIVTWCKQQGSGAGTGPVQRMAAAAAHLCFPAAEATAGWLYVLCFMSRLQPQLATALGVLPVHRIYARQVTSGMLLLSCVLLALGEQVQVGLQLPAPMTFGLALLEVAGHMVVAARLNAASFTYCVALLLCSVAPRLLVDIRLRAQMCRTVVVPSHARHGNH